MGWHPEWNRCRATCVLLWAVRLGAWLGLRRCRPRSKTLDWRGWLLPSLWLFWGRRFWNGRFRCTLCRFRFLLGNCDLRGGFRSRICRMWLRLWLCWVWLPLLLLLLHWLTWLSCTLTFRGYLALTLAGAVRPAVKTFLMSGRSQWFGPMLGLARSPVAWSERLVGEAEDYLAQHSFRFTGVTSSGLEFAFPG